MKNEECRIRSARRCFFPVIHHSSFVILLVLGLLFPAGTFGQSANRWLLIFDTSSGMRHRAKGVQDELQDLLMTGMHGEMHRGDSVGIWTFDNKLHMGETPLQVWSPEVSQTICLNTLQFVDSLHYGKSANMEAVLTNLYAVVNASPFITIIVFSDGSEPIKGTPFDGRINALYKQNYRRQRAADMPILTVLQAKGGVFTTNTVNPGPWPVEIPAVPRPLVVKAVAPPPPPAPKPAPPPPPVPPLILSGRKPESTPNAESSTPSMPANNFSQVAPAVVPMETAPIAAIQNPATLAGSPATVPVAVQPALSESRPTSAPAVTAAPPPEVTATSQTASNAVAAHEPAPSVDKTQSPSQPEAAAKPSAAPPPAETATSVPPSSLFSARNIAICSVVFMVIVIGLVLMSARNARKSQASLITRSLDREKK